jgi:chemotaxis response regulator CheB
MQHHTRSKILVVTNGCQKPGKIRAMFPHNGAGKDIQVARSHMGALEMARNMQPQLCILSHSMVLVQGRYFPDALKELCPEIDIFIAEDHDLADGEANAAASSHS